MLWQSHTSGMDARLAAIKINIHLNIQFAEGNTPVKVAWPWWITSALSDLSDRFTKTRNTAFSELCVWVCVVFPALFLFSPLHFFQAVIYTCRQPRWDLNRVIKIFGARPRFSIIWHFSVRKTRESGCCPNTAPQAPSILQGAAKETNRAWCLRWPKPDLQGEVLIE